MRSRSQSHSEQEDAGEATRASTPPPAEALRASPTPAALLALQRTAGNHAATLLLAPSLQRYTLTSDYTLAGATPSQTAFESQRLSHREGKHVRSSTDLVSGQLVKTEEEFDPQAKDWK